MGGAARTIAIEVCLAAAVGLFLAPAPAVGQTVYVAFGDSITAGVGDDPNRAEEGYPPRLEDLLQERGRNAQVRNRGVGGEKTPEGLSRIDEVLDEGGDVLLLMEGSNDISRSISIETTLFNLGEMARRAEGRGWRAVQATVIPRIPNARQDPDNVLNRQLVQGIRNLAGTEGRDLVDNFEVFLGLPDSFGQYYLQDPQDHVGHPNAAGYDVMARAFADVLTDVDSVPPVPGLLSPPHGARNVRADETIDVEVWDFGRGIDLAATELLIDGEPVAVTGSGGSRRVRFQYTPPEPLSGVVRVGLRARDRAVPANRFDRVIAEVAIEGTDLLRGDIDRSGRVDGLDLVTLARHFGATENTVRYLAAADLDGSGTIDGEDLAILASNFGNSSF